MQYVVIEDELGWGELPPDNWLSFGQCVSGLEDIGHRDVTFRYSMYNNTKEHIYNHQSLALDVGKAIYHTIMYRLDWLRTAHNLIKARRDYGSQRKVIPS